MVVVEAATSTRCRVKWTEGRRGSEAAGLRAIEGGAGRRFAVSFPDPFPKRHQEVLGGKRGIGREGVRLPGPPDPQGRGSCHTGAPRACGGLRGKGGTPERLARFDRSITAAYPPVLTLYGGVIVLAILGVTGFGG